MKEEIIINKLIELDDKQKEKDNKINQLESVIDKAINELDNYINFCENDSQGHYEICNIAIHKMKNVLEILRSKE